MQASYDAGVTDEFIEPIVIDGTPRIEPGDTRDLLQLPSRPRPAALAAAARPRRRPDDDDALRADLDSPVVFAEQQVADTLAEVLSAHGLRQLHVAETEKYAHVTYFFNGGVEERVGRGDADPRPEPARRAELRPQAGDVGRRGRRPRSAARSATATASRVVNFANPDMVGHTGVDPGRRRRRSRRPTAASAGSSSGSRELGGVCLITADHGNAEKHARAGRRLAAHRAHDEPGAARRHGRAGGAPRRRRARRPRADGPRLLDVPAPPEMTGNDFDSA